MMTLTIPGQQRWNEKTEEFVYTPAVVLKLEHSLLSLAHWESNWNIPFLSNLDKLTVEEMPASSRRYPYVAFQQDREVGKDIYFMDRVSKTVGTVPFH